MTVVGGAPGELTEDAFLGGRLVLRQPRRGHRAGHDAVLLAAATAALPGEHAVDLGSGAGAAGLALARRVPGLTVTLVEIDAGLAALAAENIRVNDLADRVQALAVDVGAPASAFARAGLAPGKAKRVLMNPPFNDPQRHQRSPDRGRDTAHAGGSGGLAIWVRCAARLLCTGGTLALIWRADGLGGVLDAIATRFGDIVVLPVHPKPDRPAIRILVHAVKGRRSPLTLLPGFVLADQEGRPTAAATAVLRGAAILPLSAP